ncbi:MAG: glutamate--cysteine ligase [Polaromonas sp. 24-62-144]|nr:MAG: glutamate--cysteine ligase [Polaromonas sp. 24-62-144]
MRSQHVQALKRMTPARLKGMRCGIEKESLRAQPGGALALTPHPAALGSALTHPSITTDFSESQVELVTGVHGTVDAALDELTQIHQFTYRAMKAVGDEMLWVSSMPCGLPTDETIPVARFGSSNVGRAKSVYRLGLSHRYGRRMQTISGIHYNWSFPGVTNDDYFGLIRNFRRQAFLLLYLFGASPAVCSSFVAGRQHELQRLSESTMYMRYGTSLRMSRLGYQSDAQASLAVSYNSLDGYAASLHDALTRGYPAYEKVGIRNPGGDYNQLGTTLLQIENEFYGTIRPKRVIFPGERPLHALRERGVEYIEVRLMDLDPFEPVGITTHKLTDWGLEILAQCSPIAEALDAAHSTSDYTAALEAARAGLEQPDTLPSARVLAVMAKDFDNSFVQFARAQSRKAQAAVLALPFSEAQQARFQALAQQSVVEQKTIENADSMPFEIYREKYLSAERLGQPRAQPVHA